MKRYEHTQIGYLTLSAILLVAAFVAIMGIVWPSDRGIRLTNATFELILLICAVIFSKLTIRIDGENLRACFGMGIVLRKTLLNEISECEPIRIRWWDGWGIHLTPYGWLYNVSGLDAVAILLRDGRKFALGTDDPHGLVAAIQRFRSVK